MTFQAPIVPALRGDLDSAQIRELYGMIATEFSLMPDTLGAGEQGFSGGQWDNATLNTPTIIGGSVGTTGHATVAVTAYHIYNKTDSYNSGLNTDLVGFVRDTTGKLRLWHGASVKIFFDDSHNLVMGTGTSELATTASGGFLYLSTTNGTATGSPTAYTGSVPMVFDRSNLKIGVYTGGAWKWTSALS